MAITVDWGTKIINIPRADMLLIQASPEIRQLDVNSFRLTLKDLEDDEEGMPHVNTHNHNPPVTVAGTTLARVVEIINGYTVTFEDGQYRVVLVGANNNILDVANLNQVSIAPTNSAGLQDLNSLQAASFQGEVALDITSIYSGTDFPVGTRGFPVNNVTDAISIAEDRGLRNLIVLSDMTMTSGDFSDGYAFRGDSPVTLTLTLDPAANVTNCTFQNMTITGTLDGDNQISDCIVENVNFFNGQIFNSALNGTITLGGNIQAGIFDCWSNIAGSGPGNYPVIDMGGSGQELVLRNFAGGIGITNGTGAADDSSIDMSSGRVVIEASVTNGSYTIRGVADVVDNSTGATVVTDRTVNDSLERLEKVSRNKTVTDPTTGIMTVYDDDDVTVLFTAQLYEDAGELQTYRGQGAEVRERLT